MVKHSSFLEKYSLFRKLPFFMSFSIYVNWSFTGYYITCLSCIYVISMVTVGPSIIREAKLLGITGSSLLSSHWPVVLFFYYVFSNWSDSSQSYKILKINVQPRDVVTIINYILIAFAYLLEHLPSFEFANCYGSISTISMSIWNELGYLLTQNF